MAATRKFWGEDLVQVLELRKAGLTYREIDELTEVSGSWAQRLLKGATRGRTPPFRQQTLASVLGKDKEWAVSVAIQLSQRRR